jgi:hypothetical protein
MSTSRPTPTTLPQKVDERIPPSELGYFQARNRNRIYDLVLSEFGKSGISNAELARRLGKRPEVVCRWLGAPGNWTLDTVSDLLLGISNAEARYSIHYPREESIRNYNGPSWVYPSVRAPKSNMATSNAITVTTSPKYQPIKPASNRA